MVEPKDEKLVVERDSYRVELDRGSGAIIGLYTLGSASNWVATPPAGRFGVPFFNGTQDQESFLALHPTKGDQGLLGPLFQSYSGRTRVQYAFGEPWIHIDAQLPRDSGPRAGLSLDLNILDLPTGSPWTEQVTPVVLYTDEALQYAYFVWQRSAHEYLALLVDGPLAAWRIKYSYAGHRMTGFQVLAQADDVRRRDGSSLPVVEQLRIRLAFAHSVSEGLARIAEGLGLALIDPAFSGGIVGASVPWTLLGQAAEMIGYRPDRRAMRLEQDADRGRLDLDEPGMYRLVARGINGRQHVTRLYAHEPWEAIYDRCNRFHRDYYQHPSGAYYRVISVDTLKPDKLTFEGTPFGDPFVSHSCRTGEFGGFCAWAMIKNMLIYGVKDEFLPSVQRYLFDWALNRGHEDQPYPATVYKKPATYLGREYTAYHLWEEINYPQHEVFLLGELVDYYRLTGDRAALDEAVRLAEHFIHDHVEESGMVVCQNAAGQEPHDYTTVDVPLINVAMLGRALQGLGNPQATFYLDWAERMADFLVRRGPDFQTEGEACTEDGSMACTAASALYAYLYIKPKREYLALGSEILAAHDKLVLKGPDARMYHSSLRFWETQYESRSWGPSINAGHGWTMWTAMAKSYMYLITRQISWLLEAYASAISNLTRIDTNGAFFPCYTPDMIPGTPHHESMWHRPLGEVLDTRQSSTYLAMGYPDAYSASGNHLLIRAAEIWSCVSGVLLSENVTINGYFDADGVFVSAAPRFEHLALSAIPERPMRVATQPGQQLTITVNGAIPRLVVEGAESIVVGETELTCRVTSRVVVIRSDQSM
jgi:hypothetical protein